MLDCLRYGGRLSAGGVQEAGGKAARRRLRACLIGADGALTATAAPPPLSSGQRAKRELFSKAWLGGSAASRRKWLSASSCESCLLPALTPPRLRAMPPLPPAPACSTRHAAPALCLVVPARIPEATSRGDRQEPAVMMCAIGWLQVRSFQTIFRPAASSSEGQKIGLLATRALARVWGGGRRRRCAETLRYVCFAAGSDLQQHVPWNQRRAGYGRVNGCTCAADGLQSRDTRAVRPRQASEGGGDAPEDAEDRAASLKCAFDCGTRARGKMRIRQRRLVSKSRAGRHFVGCLACALPHVLLCHCQGPTCPGAKAVNGLQWSSVAHGGARG